MEKRLIIAFALTILVFIAFQQFQQRNINKPVNTQPSTEIPIQKQNKPIPVREVPAEETPKPTNPSLTDTVAAAQDVVVDGDLYRAVIDNRGAVIKSWELKKYKSSQDKIFEMVAANHGGANPLFPTSLIFQDQALTSSANSQCYQILVNGKAYDGKPVTAPASVVLKLKRGDLTIEKRFSFEKDNYALDVATDFQLGGKPLSGRFFLGQDIGPEQEHLLSSTKLEVAYYSGGKVRRQGPPKDENEIKKIDGDIRWVGLDMHYFAMIAIPTTPLSYIEIQKRPVKAVGLDGKQVDRDLLRVTIPDNGSLQCQMYLGPKRQSNLKSIQAADITGIINYGMFSILVHPLLGSLRWIYQFVHNYGAAIIILTFLLSLLLFPFRLKQMVSMKKMQVVQPKVKAIQEKYRRYKKSTM
jgi:YidC/Oxa1 family membrane protein insertase